jgi:hypothetical protein
MVVVLDQQIYRIRTDATAAQGGTPVWAAAQNTTAAPPVAAAFRIRFALASSGSTTPPSSTFTIQVSRNAGAFASVPFVASTNPVYCADATAGASADNSAITTSLLTGATGIFQAGQYDDTGSAATFVLTAGNYTEIEYGLRFQSAFVTAGDTYAFRMNQGVSPLTTYTNTPTLTFALASQARVLVLA